MTNGLHPLRFFLSISEIEHRYPAAVRQEEKMAGEEQAKPSAPGESATYDHGGGIL
jgi:hypothetical protein